MTPDQSPIMDSLSRYGMDNIIVGTGYSGSGFKVSEGTGHSAQVAGRSTLHFILTQYMHGGII
jgi:glycine/D-amino acid oxidase-like deaminating enzyme